MFDLCNKHSLNIEKLVIKVLQSFSQRLKCLFNLNKLNFINILDNLINLNIKINLFSFDSFHLTNWYFKFCIQSFFIDFIEDFKIKVFNS